MMTLNEDYLKHIDRLIQQRPAARAALESYRELARLMVQAEPSPKLKRPEPAHLKIEKNEGFPFLQRKDLPVDFTSASRLLNRFFKYLSQTGREDQAGFDNTLKKSKNDPQWYSKLLNAILQQDETVLTAMAQEVSLDVGVLLFLGKTALRPSLLALGHLLEKDMKEKPWEKGYCPLCGSEPDMAWFTQTGKRVLHCELCGKQWAFARIACPFCNNREQKDLGYLEAKGEEGLRVYVCRSCLRYLKTIDSRVFEEVAPMDLESLATLHLDLIASQNGYK
jgi:FdhE protein